MSDTDVADGSLPEWIDHYVAAVIDGSSTFTISVLKDSSLSIGYRVRPKLQFKADSGELADVLEAYCTQVDATVRRSTESGNYSTITLTATSHQAIERILRQCRPYLVGKATAVTLYLDEVLPAIRAGATSDQEQFLLLLEDIEDLREASGRANRSKYDLDYFRSEWEDIN